MCKEKHDRHGTACTGKGLQEQQSSRLTPRALLQGIDTMLSREFTMPSVTNTANKNCPTATSQTSENGSVLQCHQINKLILNLDFFFNNIFYLPAVSATLHNTLFYITLSPFKME